MSFSFVLCVISRPVSSFNLFTGILVDISVYSPTITRVISAL